MKTIAIVGACSAVTSAMAIVNASENNVICIDIAAYEHTREPPDKIIEYQLTCSDLAVIEFPEIQYTTDSTKPGTFKNINDREPLRIVFNNLMRSSSES